MAFSGDVLDGRFLHEGAFETLTADQRERVNEARAQAGAAVRLAGLFRIAGRHFEKMTSYYAQFNNASLAPSSADRILSRVRAHMAEDRELADQMFIEFGDCGEGLSAEQKADVVISWRLLNDSRFDTSSLGFWEGPASKTQKLSEEFHAVADLLDPPIKTSLWEKFKSFFSPAPG